MRTIFDMTTGTNEGSEPSATHYTDEVLCANWLPAPMSGLQRSTPERANAAYRPVLPADSDVEAFLVRMYAAQRA